MDSEPFCDLWPWVEPVEDFHGDIQGWASRGDYWLQAYADVNTNRNRWRAIAEDWERVAMRAIAQRHWVENTALVSLLVLLVIVAVKSL